MLGDRTRALEWAAAALTIAPGDPLTLYNVACDYALLGEVDLSLDVLERWRPRANARTNTGFATTATELHPQRSAFSDVS